MSNEHMHTKACQAHALITAIENIRDDSSIEAVDFRLMVQDRAPMHIADSYLDMTQVGEKDVICLPECGASAYNYMWHWAHNLDHNDLDELNRFFDTGRRLLRPQATKPGDIDPEYSYTKLFRWAYDFWAENDHREATELPLHHYEADLDFSEGGE